MIVHPPSGDIKGLVDLCSNAVHDVYTVGSNEARTFYQENLLDVGVPIVWADDHQFKGLPLTPA
jgi:hypothetical protein